MAPFNWGYSLTILFSVVQHFHALVIAKEVRTLLDGQIFVRKMQHELNSFSMKVPLRGELSNRSATKSPLPIMYVSEAAGDDKTFRLTFLLTFSSTLCAHPTGNLQSEEASFGTSRSASLSASTG